MVRIKLAMIFPACFLSLLLISHSPAADKDKEKEKEKEKAAEKDKPVDKDEVKKAIDNAVAFLKDAQAKNGSWGGQGGKGGFGRMNGYEVGTTSLVALALLASDVPANDPVIEKAAEYTRDAVPDLTFTHSVGATILFLDRLGDPKDVPAIKTLSARLLGGQSPDGGWGYECPKIPVDTVAKWTKPEQFRDGIVKAVKELQDPKNKNNPNAGIVMGGLGGMTENSCSEFAVQGLWIGRRHEVPVHASLAKFESYCRNSQLQDGTFPYSSGKGFGMFGQSLSGTPCMTCSGLLGLVYSNGSANETALLKYAKSKDAAKTPAPALGKGLRDPEKDTAMKKGLAALETAMKTSDIPPPAPAKVGVPFVAPKPGQTNHWTPEGTWVYMAFWAVERVGVAYGKDKIGKIDWYNWGAKLLLKYQEKDGSWGGANRGFMGNELSTGFALLFLRKAELAPDLATISKGVLPLKISDDAEKDKDKDK